MKWRTWSVGTAIFLVACAALVGVWRLRRGGSTGTPTIEIEERDPAWQTQIRLGTGIYARHCSSCHGASFEGQPNWKKRLPDGSYPAPPLDETGHTWHHPDSVLFATVKLGGQATAPPDFRSNMPSFSGVLSDNEIHAVLALIKSRWPREIRRLQEEINQHGSARVAP